MRTPQGILLTGATGLLGRYLLRDLLATGRPVGVLLRPSQDRTAAERLEELLAFGSDTLGRGLPRPVLLHGDLRTPHVGLEAVERRWLAKEVATVVHAAACVSHRATVDGEPWETNVNGTRRLLELCRSLGLTEVHHVSTAFVCGDRRGVVREDELDCGRGSGNAYGESKYAAEQLVQGFAGICATVYRPSIIVGDSRTGYTSTYHHFYRFLELAIRLCRPEAESPRQRLPVRLPLTGEETQNLVPVDWVSRALVELLGRPRWHGRTFHLVAYQPVRLRALQRIVEEVLPIEGVQWAGLDGLADPTALERLVLDEFRDYWSYLQGNLVFDCRNTREALPELPPPPFDRALVARLLRFARDDNWGRDRGTGQADAGPDCARYLEDILPALMRRSPLGQVLPRGLLFALEVRGPGGGQWSCHCGDGGIVVRRGVTDKPVVTYRTDAATFDALIRGRQAAQAAFFEGRIEMAGDTEKALKLGALIEQFLRQNTEAFHAAA